MQCNEIYSVYKNAIEAHRKCNGLDRRIDKYIGLQRNI